MLKWIVCAAALLPLSGLAAEKPVDCQVGVQLYSFRHDLEKDLRGTLTRVKQLGIRCIEPYSLHGRSADELRVELDRAGLAAVSFHLPAELRKGDPAQAARVTKILGAQQMGIGWIKESNTDAITGDRLMAAAKLLNGMCPAARAANLKVFYHPHGYEFHEGDPEGKLFERFVNALDRDCVVLQLDAFWVAYGGQDPVKFMRKYGDRVWSYHVKEMSPTLPVGPFDGSKWQGSLTDEAFAPLGKGKLDQPALMKLGKQYGVKWFILEDETTRPYEGVALALPYLKAHGIE
jgi:sugar phosphate isomerase/epimerase